ncbi:MULTISPECIES: Scr1 family TA system antitoxin-like transcriptional regulator [Streptomyces]
MPTVNSLTPTGRPPHARSRVRGRRCPPSRRVARTAVARPSGRRPRCAGCFPQCDPSGPSLRRGPHVGLSSSFNVISFAGPGAMDVVYLETPFTRLWIEGGEGAASHNEPYETITARCSNEGDSLSFLQRLRKEL